MLPFKKPWPSRLTFLLLFSGYGPNPASLYASQLVPKPPKIIRPKDLAGKLRKKCLVIL